MNIDIVCKQSAFKHGITEADIRMAFDTARYDEILGEFDGDEAFDGKYLLIGFDRNANLLEVLYNVIDDDTLNVFHAMKCRNIYAVFYFYTLGSTSLSLRQVLFLRLFLGFLVMFLVFCSYGYRSIPVNSQKENRCRLKTDVDKV
jgi:hypothetical protein